MLGSKPTIIGLTTAKAITKLKEDINSDKTPKKKATGTSTLATKKGDNGGTNLLKPPIGNGTLAISEKKNSNSLNPNGDFSKRHTVLIYSSGAINGSSN